MTRAAAIGEAELVSGFALAGVEVHPAAGEDEVRLAWERLSDDVVLVVLTPAAASALPEDDAAKRRLRVVLP